MILKTRENTITHKYLYIPVVKVVTLIIDTLTLIIRIVILTIRTVTFIRVKIICFLILPLLFTLLIFSLFEDQSTALVALLDLPKYRIYFGLYLVIMGISTSVINSRKTKIQTQCIIEKSVVLTEQKRVNERALEIIDLITGILFIIGGAIFTFIEIAESTSWYPNRVIFGSVPVRFF